jgi:hypothetical protein
VARNTTVVEVQLLNTWGSRGAEMYRFLPSATNGTKPITLHWLKDLKDIDEEALRRDR